MRILTLTGVTVLVLAVGPAPAARAEQLELAMRASSGVINELWGNDESSLIAESGTLSDSVVSAFADEHEGSAFVHGQVSFGVLRLEAIATSGGVGTGGGSFAEAAARFSDDLTVIAGPIGSPATMEFSVHFDGALSIVPEQPTSNAEARGLTVVAAWANSSFGNFSEEIGIFSTMVFDETVVIEAQFQSGETFEVGAAIAMEIAESVSDTDSVEVAAVVSDFFNTARWGGILSVRDASGAPIEDWSIVSASGTDYRGPAVPEPASAWLVGLALAGVCAARLRCDRRRRARTAARR